VPDLLGHTQAHSTEETVRGHARNALVLLVGYAASIGVTRLEAHIASGNHASRRVAEAAGFA
jgi:RimJ/RimL family protein N-acetyltransferase